jgi:hypothetical protein
MAKTKFNLTPKPTFTAAVPVPVPGEGPTDVQFTFKGRTREQFKELLEVKDGTKLDAIMEIASGWELDEPFDRSNVEKLLDNYLGAFDAIWDTYLRELTQARLGN